MFSIWEASNLPCICTICVLAEEDEPEEAEQEEERAESGRVVVEEDSRVVQARHYKTLQELWRRPKPNQRDVAQLLELEFDSRRSFIDSKTLNEEDRPAKILEAYPCFKELKHVSGVKFTLYYSYSGQR